MSQSLNILLVEDNVDHAELVPRHLAGYQNLGSVRCVEDGEAALDYLFRHGRFADPDAAPSPHVILLDLRLPKVDGFEVLRTVKETASLARIPVVILTTSR